MTGAARGPVSVVIVGDTVLDVDVIGRADRLCADAPVPVVDVAGELRRPGCAGLAATMTATSGHDVTLVTALGEDANGREVTRRLDAAGVHVVDLGLHGATPCKERVRIDGRSLLRLDLSCDNSSFRREWSDEARRAIAAADAVLVSDYGRGMAALATTELGSVDAPIVWDPHPRGPVPPQWVDTATPNRGEAVRLNGVAGLVADDVADLFTLAESLRQGLGVAIVITAGSIGAVLAEPSRALRVVTTTPRDGDPCGAGDRFAATFAIARGAGSDRGDALVAAVADATAWVCGDRGDTVPFAPPAAATSAAAVRAQGGTVVAAGGCFDMLHAGHIELLEAARRLGDHLVVLVNSDASVRRLKGAGRPVNGLADRIRVLQSLRCVDSVMSFDDDTPSRALEVVRPHIFVKGADYAARTLAEEATLAACGGRLVTVPLVAAHSTTESLRRWERGRLREQTRTGRRWSPVDGSRREIE